MLQLHQFRHSAFCEKVRLVLAVKDLPYSPVEVTPGLGQIGLFRLSGQRQVPVLVDGSTVIPDSTAIALYLEELQPAPPLLPADPLLRARVRLLEDWADTTLAAGVRLALLQAAVVDPLLRTALLPDDLPSTLRSLVGGLPAGPLAGVGEALAQGSRQDLQVALEQLVVLVEAGPFLVGDQLSIADLAVVAQLSLLSFPAHSGEPLAGHGVPGLADHPMLAPLFQWRDQLLANLPLA
jgi:glutathione S-transferase